MLSLFLEELLGCRFLEVLKLKIFLLGYLLKNLVRNVFGIELVILVVGCFLLVLNFEVMDMLSML